MRSITVRQEPSAARLKDMCIAISPADAGVPYDLGGDEAEGDAVPAVPQRNVILVRSQDETNYPRPGADAAQAIAI